MSSLLWLYHAYGKTPNRMKAKVAIKRLVSSFETRLFLRRAINLPRDSFNSITGRRDPLIPPHGLWYVGGEENYREINEEFLKHFIELGGLKPRHRILDVGCGIGVAAARLTAFLSSEGSYEGFDIVKIGIDWANAHIGRRFPNFRFTHADLFNEHYNPKGRLDSSTFVFPYDSDSFDFIFLKSVFTHMRPESVQNYLREIHRVLKPGGRCLVTAFLLNEESRGLIAAGQSSLDLRHDLGDYSVLDPKFPETAVGFPEHSFEAWYLSSGLALCGPAQYGSWCGRKQYLSYQDILVLGSNQIDRGLSDRDSREGFSRT
jgi:SAM-dependent methyltransferase